MKSYIQILEISHKNCTPTPITSCQSEKPGILSSGYKMILGGAIGTLQSRHENIKAARETNPEFNMKTTQIENTPIDDKRKRKRKRKRVRNKNKIQNIGKELKENEYLVDYKQQMNTTPSSKKLINPNDRKQELSTKSFPIGTLDLQGTMIKKPSEKMRKISRKIALSRVRKAKSTTTSLGGKKKNSKVPNTLGHKIGIIFKSDANEKSAISPNQVDPIPESCNTSTRFKQKRLRKRLKKILLENNLEKDQTKHVSQIKENFQASINLEIVVKKT